MRTKLSNAENGDEPILLVVRADVDAKVGLENLLEMAVNVCWFCVLIFALISSNIDIPLRSSSIGITNVSTNARA